MRIRAFVNHGVVSPDPLGKLRILKPEWLPDIKPLDRCHIWFGFLASRLRYPGKGSRRPRDGTRVNLICRHLVLEFSGTARERLPAISRPVDRTQVRSALLPSRALRERLLSSLRAQLHGLCCQLGLALRTLDQSRQRRLSGPIRRTLANRRSMSALACSQQLSFRGSA
jgi:hypothetical protein